MNYSILEQTINRVMEKIGTQMLIRHLNDFEKNIDFYLDKNLVFIQKTVLDYFKLDEKDLSVNYFKTDDHVNARRALVYFLRKKTNIPAKEVRDMYSISAKSYKRYYDHACRAIDEKGVNNELKQAIETMENIINSKQNG